MARGDEGALHRCCGGLMSRRGHMANAIIEAVCALAMALSGGHALAEEASPGCGTTCARFAQLLCDFVGRAASPQQQLALGREMYAARKASSSGTPELYSSLALAAALMSCEQHDEAIPLFQEVVRLSDWTRCAACNAAPSPPECECKGDWAAHCMCLAMCYKKAGRRDEGRAFCREAVDAFADDQPGRLVPAPIKLGMALCMRNLEEHACALRVFLGMMDIAPEDDRDAAVTCRMGAAECLLATGDAAAAYSYAEAVATIVSPGSANATAALNLLKRCARRCDKAGCKEAVDISQQDERGMQERQDAADAAMRRLLAEDAVEAARAARAASTHALKVARRAARKANAALKAAGHHTLL